MVYQRSGDWQTGYAQRTSEYNKVIKDGQALVKELKERAKTDLLNQERQLKGVRAETERIFKVQTGIDSYEVSKVKHISGKFQEFLGSTMTQIGKEVKEHQERKDAVEASKSIADRHEVKVVQPPSSETVSEPGSGSIYDLIASVGGEVGQQLDGVTTWIELKPDDIPDDGGPTALANAAHNNAGAFAKLAKEKSDGGHFIEAEQLASKANNGLNVEQQALLSAEKVKSVRVSFEGYLQSDEANNTWLTIDDGEPFRVSDAFNDPDKLRAVKEWYLGKWVKANQGALHDWSADRLLRREGRKSLDEFVQERVLEIRQDASDQRIQIQKNIVRAAVNSTAGIADLTTVFNNFSPLIVNELEPANNKGVLTQSHDILDDLLQDIIKTAGPKAAMLAERINEAMAATEITTPAGTKSLPNHYAAKFGADVITEHGRSALSEWRTGEIARQKADVRVAELTVKEEIKQNAAAANMSVNTYLDSEDGKLFLQGWTNGMRQKNQLALPEITSAVGRLEMGTLGPEDTERHLEDALLENKGIILKSNLLDVDMDVAETWIKDRNLEIYDQDPSTQYDSDGKIVSELGGLLSNQLKEGYVPGLTSKNITLTRAIEHAEVLAHERTRDILSKDPTANYRKVLKNEVNTLTQEIRAGFNDTNSDWYHEAGVGFSKFLTDQAKDTDDDVVLFEKLKNFRDQKLDLNKNAIITAEDVAKWPDLVKVDENSMPVDPTTAALARKAGMSPVDFINLQLKLQGQPLLPVPDSKVKVQGEIPQISPDALTENNYYSACGNMSPKCANRITKNRSPEHIFGLTLRPGFTTIADTETRNEVNKHWPLIMEKVARYFGGDKEVGYDRNKVWRYASRMLLAQIIYGNADLYESEEHKQDLDNRMNVLRLNGVFK